MLDCGAIRHDVSCGFRTRGSLLLQEELKRPGESAVYDLGEGTSVRDRAHLSACVLETINLRLIFHADRSRLAEHPGLASKNIPPGDT